MISPEDDFQTWGEIFRATIEPNGEYQLFLPDFSRLLCFYSQNSSLPNQLDIYTKEFVDRTALSLLDQLMCLNRLSEKDLNIIKQTFKQINNSMAVGFTNEVPNCDQFIFSILRNDQCLYQKNGVTCSNQTSLFNEITQSFVHEGPLTVLSDYVAANPTLSNYDFLAKIISKFGYYIKQEEGTALLEKLQYSLMFFFAQFDDTNIRDSNFQDIVKFTIKYLSSNEMLQDLRVSMLNFGNLCLRSKYIDKNLIGSEIFLKIADLDIPYFQKFVKDTQMVDFLLSNDLHLEVLTQLSSIVSKFFQNEHFDLQKLMQLYNRAELSHYSLKSALNTLLANALKTCNENTITLFLEQITKEKVTPDLMGFLQAFIYSSSNQNPEAVSFSIRFILSLLDQENEENIEMVEESIGKLCDCVLTKECRSVIFEYLLLKIKNGNIPSAQYHSIKKLVKSVMFMGETEAKQLINICIENKCVKLVKSILMYSQIKLPSSGLEILSSNVQGWSILAKVIKKRGISILEYAEDKTASILKTFDFENATITQFFVIKEILLTLAVSSKKVDTFSQTTGPIGSFYKVVDPRIDGTEMIFNFIALSKDSTVSENAMLFLLELYKEVSHHYFEIFAQDILYILRSLSLENESVSIRYLRMLNSMIELGEKNFDVSDFGIVRHKNRRKHDITFTIRAGANLCDITCKPSTLGSDLMAKITNKLGKANEFLSITNENGSTVKYGEPISECGIKDGSLLTISNPESLKSSINRIETCMTKIIAQDDIVEKFFNTLKNDKYCDELKDAIWHFLMLMPSVKDITVDLLNKATTKMEIRYIIQYFKSFPTDSAYKTVVNMLCHNKIDLFGLIDALELIQYHMNFESEETATLFADFLLNCLSNQEKAKAHPLVVDVLQYFSNRYQLFITTQLLSNTDRFSQIILGLSRILLSRLVNVFKNLTNYSKAFSMLFSMLEHVKIRSDIICEYFALVTTVFNESCDINSTISLCISMLDQPGTPLFDSVCTFLAHVFSQQHSKLQKYDSLFKFLLNNLFIVTNPTTQGAIISLLTLFCFENDANKREFHNSLANHFSIETERWSYDPAANTRSATGFTGLRNLGATCYMNSVFQQLFFNDEFRSNVFKMRPTVDWQIELRALFIKLLKTNLVIADTQMFFSRWKFFDDEPVNPRIQQDSVEFLQLLLDRINDELFKGDLVNIIEGEDFRKEYTEPFWALPLEVKGCKSFNDSFTSFLHKDSVSNIFVESLQKKVDALKYAKVQKMPKHLVLQLKRFDYNITTWTKYKVNDKFIFPKEFDLSPLTENVGQQQSNYLLNGFIMHSGTVDGGHYQSYIKNGEKWYVFNDTSVTESNNERVLFEEAYGDASQTTKLYDNDSYIHKPSAYLLFYVKKDEDIYINYNKNMNLCDFSTEGIDEEYDKDLLTGIEEENSNFQHMQSAFGTAMMNVVLNTEELAILKVYFVNVFCHSFHTANATKFSNHFIDIVGRNNAEDEVMVSLLEKVGKVNEILVHCTNDDILEAVLNVFRYLIDKSSVEYGRKFASCVLDGIESVLNNWRSIHHFFEIVIQLCEKDNEWSNSEKWPQKLFSYVKSALEGSKSSVYIQNVNFSSFFSYFSNHLDDFSQEEANDLFALSHLVLQSTAHGEVYMEIIKKSAKLGKIDIPAFLKKFLSAPTKDLSSSMIVSLFSQLSDNMDAMIKFLNSPRISKETIVNSISKDLDVVNDTYDNQRKTDIDVYTNTRQKLINNGLIPFYFITCDDHKATSEMEQVYLQLFPAVNPLDDFSRAESALSPNSSSFVKFVWKDKSDSYALNSDYQEMTKLLFEIIKGIGDMVQHPENYFYGQRLNKKFVHMIRVLNWMILRTQVSFTKPQTQTLFAFFDTLHQHSIYNNTNLIELIRVLKVLPDREPIVENFDRFASITFTSDFDNLLTEFAFVVFFDSLESEFLKDPELIQRLLNIDGFSKAFGAVSQSCKKSSFKAFSSIILAHQIDISKLIQIHLTALLQNHAFFLLTAIYFSKSFTITEELFNSLISAVFVVLSAFAFSKKKNIHNPMKFQIAFDLLHSLFSTFKQINNTTEFSPYMPRVVPLLWNPFLEPLRNNISRFIIDICLISEELKRSAIDLLQYNDDEIPLTIRFHIGDQEMREKVGEAISKKSMTDVTPNIIEIVGLIYEKDGPQNWMKKFADELLQSGLFESQYIMPLMHKLSDIIDFQNSQQENK